jgi:hypothetical protein
VADPVDLLFDHHFVQRGERQRDEELDSAIQM